MINEQLYQLAQDELDSDQRKAEIWARACALASNDHDEARYLYTNLRVEQMLADKSVKDRELAQSGGLPQDELTLAPQEENAPVSQRAGQTSDSKKIDDELPVSSEQSVHSSTSGNTDSLELSEDKEFDLDPAVVEAMNRDEPGTASAIDGTLSDLRTPITMEENPVAFWAQQQNEQMLSNAKATRSNEESSANSAEALSKELERQAIELPGQQSDIVAFESAEEVQQAAAELEETSMDLTDAPIMQDFATEDRLGDLDNELPIIPGAGKLYQVFRRRGKMLAVKDGVSWTAMLFTLPWLLTRSLFGTAIVYILLWITLAAGLLSAGFSWMDAGADATTAIKAWTIGFAVLAAIALLYLPFRHANRWAATKLEKKGFELDSLVYAKSRKEAINASMNSTAF